MADTSKCENCKAQEGDYIFHGIYKDQEVIQNADAEIHNYKGDLVGVDFYNVESVNGLNQKAITIELKNELCQHCANKAK